MDFFWKNLENPERCAILGRRERAHENRAHRTLANTPHGLHPH